MKKRVAVVLILIILLITFIVYFLSKNFNRGLDYNNDSILFYSYSGSGPCPSGNICWQSTTLYYSGKLILNGSRVSESVLDKKVIDSIKSKIESTQIMSKNCSAPLMMDYYAIFEINYKGQTKKISSPGCQEETSEIYALLEQPPVYLNGA